MKMEKHWKRFFTLDRHHAEGFTLVELIVVIAILAILAGVAVPAYSGYIKKANEAADLQLLAAVNRAYASACIESGVNILDLGVDNADIKIVDRKIDVTTVQPASAQKSFEMFYGDSKDSAFSVYSDIFFDPSIHAFAFEVPVTLTYNGVTITLSARDIAALKDSTFLNADTLGGSDGLLDKVDFVTNVAAAMAGGQMSTVFADPDFIACAMSALGAETAEEYTAIQEDLLKEMMDGGLTRDQAEAKLGANAAVLYASMNAVQFTDDQIGAIFSTTGVDEIKANLTTTGKTTDGMGQAALVYGMYTAYAHSSEYGNAELQATTDDPIAVIKALENDENFKTYANSEQGKKDLEAYLGALNMISDSANSNPDAVKHLMVNGFNNQEMKDVIAGVTE